MTKDDTAAFDHLTRIANDSFDGHFIILKCTTNWRVAFGAPIDPETLRGDIDQMSVGATFAEAAEAAIANPRFFGDANA